MDLDKIYKKRINNTNTYDLLDIDYFYFYEQFDDDYLDYIISYINYNIEELNKDKVDRTELDNIINEIEEFVKKLPGGTYTETPRSNGPERYNFKINELRYNAKRNRTNWVKSIIKTKLNIKVKVIDKPEEGTYDIKFANNLSEYKREQIRELRRTILTDEEYQRRIAREKDDRKKSKRLEKKKRKLMEEYYKQKKDYRSRCLKKATEVERWERIIWVINVEKYLREYERENNLHIMRKPISSKDPYWEQYRINAKEGIINNVFILKDNLPYRLVQLKEKIPINTNSVFTKAILKRYPDNEYEGIYYIEKANNNLSNIAKSYAFEPLDFYLLLSDTNLYDKEVNLSKDIRDIEFINDLEDIKEEFDIEVIENDDEEDDDNFNTDGTDFTDLLDWSDEIDL